MLSVERKYTAIGIFTAHGVVINGSTWTLNYGCFYISLWFMLHIFSVCAFTCVYFCFWTDYAARGSKKMTDKCDSTDECGFPGSVCDSHQKTCQCIEELPVTNHIDKCGKGELWNDCRSIEYCMEAVARCLREQLSPRNEYESIANRTNRLRKHVRMASHAEDPHLKHIYIC